MSASTVTAFSAILLLSAAGLSAKLARDSRNKAYWGLTAAAVFLAVWVLWILRGLIAGDPGIVLQLPTQGIILIASAALLAALRLTATSVARGSSRLRRDAAGAPAGSPHSLISIEQLPVPASLCDGDGIIFELNGLALELSGYTRDEVIGKNIFDLGIIDRASVAKTATAPDRDAQRGPAKADDLVWTRKDGSAVHVESSSRWVTVDNRRMLLTVAQNADKRLKTEAALRLSEQSLTNAQRIGRFGNWEWDLRSGEIHRSAEIARLFGFDAESEPITFEPFFTRLHPDDREPALQALQQAIACGEPYTANYRLLDEDGTERYLRGHVEVEIDESGKAIRVSGTAQDVTKSRLAEQALRDSEERLKILFEKAPDAYFLFDYEGRFTDGNLAAEQLVGRPREELIGKSFVELDLLSAESLPRAMEELAKNAAGQATGPVEYDINSAYGTLSIEVSAYPVTIHGQQSVLGIAHDVTARKRAEEKLRASETRLLEAQRVARMGDWTWDVRAGRLHWSEQTCRLFGISDTELDLSEEAFLDILHPDDRDLLIDQVGRLLRGESRYSIDHRIVLPSGEIRYMHESGELMPSTGFEPARVVGTVLDITERKQAEQEIRELNQELERRVDERTAQLAETLQELESFSYAISHDLRQPLRTISGFIQLVEEQAADRLDDETREYLSRTRDGAARMSGMIDDLLHLSRVGRAALKHEHVDLSALAEKTIADLRAAAPERQITTVVQPGVTAHGDPGLLDLLLQNLLGNAWKFTAGTEQPRIEFGRSEAPAAEAAYFVRDNGVGFDNDHAGKIFEAFHRLHTREEFEGTGVGLATVARIVKRHGGRVWADAEEGKGAVFLFTLEGPEQAG